MVQPLWKGFIYQPHQVEGIQWMLDRERQIPSGGILCDEMGLGKTIQMIGLMNESKGKNEKTLLVGPLAVLDQWQTTAITAGFQIWTSHPTKARWILSSKKEEDKPQLYLVNYERARQRAALVNTFEWTRVIFDEAHKIGNPKTQNYKIAASIHATHKWFLTATPITNTIMNAVCLFQILGIEHPANTVRGLQSLISEMVLCRKMEDLRDTIQSLPQAAESVIHSLEFDSSEEEEFYRGIQGILQKQWKMTEQEANGGAERLRIIMRLRQISIHPQVYIAARKKSWANYDREDFLDASTKFNTLQSLIESESKNKCNHRWLVFCHFHEEMLLLQEHLQDSFVVRKCGIYSGKLTQEERTKILEKSKEPLYGFQQEVLLVQLQSGGVGLNLQHFDRVVFMGPWWTAAIMDQAIGRAVRIGQTNKVMVHHLLLKEEESMNIDKIIVEKAEIKRTLCDEFLSFAKS
jgi:SNF2 family DNA or RNA helicase